MTSNKELVMKTVTAHPEASGFRGLTGEPRNAEELVYELQNTVTCAYLASAALEHKLVDDEDAEWVIKAIAGTLERATHLLKNGNW